MAEPEAARHLPARLRAAGWPRPSWRRPGGSPRRRAHSMLDVDAAFASVSCCARRASWRGLPRSAPAGAACRRPSWSLLDASGGVLSRMPGAGFPFRASGRSAPGCRSSTACRPGGRCIADVDLAGRQRLSSPSPSRRRARGPPGLPPPRRLAPSAGGARRPRGSSRGSRDGRAADRRDLPALRADRLRPPHARRR